MKWMLVVVMTSLEAVTHTAMPVPSHEICVRLINSMDVTVHRTMKLPQLDDPVAVEAACMPDSVYQMIARTGIKL